MKLDNVDITILEMLKKDARISFKEIARKINVSPDTISNRFERLKEQGIIVSSTVIINSKKIGYPFISLFGIDIKPAYSSQVLEKIIKIKKLLSNCKIFILWTIYSLTLST